MNLKEQAARKALTFVNSDMVLGLGSGSTTAFFVRMLGDQIRNGALHSILGVATSEETEARAQASGIPLTTLAEHPRLDLVVDGADEVDPALNLIKGLGQALLREKIVEWHAERFIVIIDHSKLVPRLGTRGPLPVEIVRFAAPVHVRWLNTLGCRAELWMQEDGSPVVTDNGNYLARCWFAEGIADPFSLAQELAQYPGIIEHGLFLGMASAVIVAAPDGTRVLERSLEEE